MFAFYEKRGEKRKKTFDLVDENIFPPCVVGESVKWLYIMKIIHFECTD